MARLALGNKLDSPILYGWARAGENPEGYSLFSLPTVDGRAATMRAMTLQERFETGCDWVVVIGQDRWGFNNPLGRVTQQVKKLVEGVGR
jgi:hypothetical protein